MNATLTTNTVFQEFKTWQYLEEHLIAYPDRKQMHRLEISIYPEQTTARYPEQRFWQYILDLDTNAALQIVYLLKEIEQKVNKIHEKYTKAGA